MIVVRQWKREKAIPWDTSPYELSRQATSAQGSSEEVRLTPAMSRTSNFT